MINGFICVYRWQLRIFNCFCSVKECDGTHSECSARQVPTWRISANIEWRDPCGHAAAWLQGSDVQGRNDRLLYLTLHIKAR